METVKYYGCSSHMNGYNGHNIAENLVFMIKKSVDYVGSSIS